MWVRKLEFGHEKETLDVLEARCRSTPGTQ